MSCTQLKQMKIKGSNSPNTPATGTDWAALDAMTEEDIIEQVRRNPDAAPILSPEEIKRQYKFHPARSKKNP